MPEPTITCPSCRTEIRLTESLAGPLIAATKAEFESRLAATVEAARDREAEVDRERDELRRARMELNERLSREVDAARSQIAEEEARKAERRVALDLQNVQAQLAESENLLRDREQRLQALQIDQAEVLRARRELEDERRLLGVTIEKAVTAELGVVREAAQREAEETLSLKVRERDELISQMQAQIAELRRKAEQGSIQLQGEVQELALEELLRDRFPFDVVTPVPKGVHGGDCVQQVRTVDGKNAGTVLWEAKRTKEWNSGWLAKLRSDQRAAQADLAVIISHSLPKGLVDFDLVEGAWVAHPRCAIPVATVLRESLIALANARRVGEDRSTKMDRVYTYLSGPKFRQHIEAVVEQFVEMRSDLERERRAMTRLWSKREQQILEVVSATAGMYGDLQAITGESLQELEIFALQEIGAPGKERIN